MPLPFLFSHRLRARRCRCCTSIYCKALWNIRKNLTTCCVSLPFLLLAQIEGKTLPLLCINLLQGTLEHKEESHHLLRVPATPAPSQVEGKTLPPPCTLLQGTPAD